MQCAHVGSIGSCVGSGGIHVGSVGTCAGSLGLFRYQHVDIGNAQVSHLGISQCEDPKQRVCIVVEYRLKAFPQNRNKDEFLKK